MTTPSVREWWHKLHDAPGESTGVQLYRSVLAGVVASVVAFATYQSILFRFGEASYLTANVFAQLLGTLTIYFLSVSWVFARRARANRWAEFGIFALLNLIAFGLTQVSLWGLVEYGHLHKTLAYLLAVFIAFVWNFVARKYFLF